MRRGPSADRVFPFSRPTARRFVGVGAVSLAIALGSPNPAAGRPAPTRTVIAFDNSGSMRDNDPQRLAEAAAMLYVQLAKKGDQVGLVVFDQRARVAVPVGEHASRRRLFSKKLARLRLNGATTDIGRALETSLKALGPPRKGVTDVVVLLTDGKVDLGRTRSGQVPAEVTRIRRELVDLYRRRGVPLYTIAFTPAADRALMDELAARTNGAFRFIKGARDLHRAFSEMFAVASSASSLPVRDGAVVVDSSVNQTSLVLSKKGPGDENTVVAPDEEVLRANSRREGMNWKSAPSYDLVELNKPQAGAWQMVGSDGKAPEAVAIVQDSALDLDVSFGPKDATVDDKLQFRVELKENGKRVSSFARLKSMTVEARVIGPDKKGRTILFEQQAEAPGIFQGEVQNKTVGHYAVSVTAMSPALQRQWRGSYSVRDSCFDHRVRTDGPQPIALVRLRKDCPEYQDLSIVVARQLDDEKPAWARMKRRKKDGLYGKRLEALGAGESGVVRIRITAKTVDGYPVRIEPEPFRLPDPPASLWMKVVGQRLAYINIPLLLVGALAFGVYRLLRQRQEIYDD